MSGLGPDELRERGLPWARLFILSVALAGVVVLCLRTPAGNLPLSALSGADVLWGRAILWSPSDEERAAIDGYFLVECRLANDALSLIAKETLERSPQDADQVHLEALSYSLVPDLVAAKRAAMEGGLVRRLPSARIGGPVIAPDHALVFATYPSIGSLVFRLDKSNQGQIWSVLSEVVRLRAALDTRRAKSAR